MYAWMAAEFIDLCYFFGLPQVMKDVFDKELKKQMNIAERILTFIGEGFVGFLALVFEVYGTIFGYGDEC